MEGWSQSVYSELQRDVDTQIHSAKSLCSICQVWDLLLFEKSHSHQCGKRSSNARPYCIRFEGKKRCEIGNPCNCQFTCLLQLHAPVADCIIASLNSDILCSLSLSLSVVWIASDCIWLHQFHLQTFGTSYILMHPRLGLSIFKGPAALVLGAMRGENKSKDIERQNRGRSRSKAESPLCQALCQAAKRSACDSSPRRATHCSCSWRARKGAHEILENEKENDMRTMQSNTRQSCVAPEVANNSKTSKTYGGEERKRRAQKIQRRAAWSTSTVQLQSSKSCKVALPSHMCKLIPKRGASARAWSEQLCNIYSLWLP